LEELQLNSTQELEDLLITAINSRVIEGQINQKQSTVAIDRFMPIDRADAEVALRKLDEWISHSKDVQIRLNWS
jgi:hypothetical protein